MLYFHSVRHSVEAHCWCSDGNLGNLVNDTEVGEKLQCARLHTEDISHIRDRNEKKGNAYHKACAALSKSGLRVFFDNSNRNPILK